MKFTANSRRRAAEYEPALVQYWKDNKTFEKSVELRPADNAYVFYDGPPFITGVPHHGTLLSSIIKDAVPRYQTMRGKRVERVWGWDCHGLPAEVYTEKKLGIHDKRDIGTTISLEDYIKACRANMVQTGQEWETTIARIGRWVNFQGAYKTMDKDYMESVWWAFKQLYDKGKIYEGEKVLLYCVRDATPVSKAEVAMDNNYQDVTDPSVYVKFKLHDYYAAIDQPDADTTQVYALAWTTTPWTLPADTAVAVNKELMYAEVRMDDGTHVLLAEQLVATVLRDEKHQPLHYDVVRTVPGSALVGLTYEPLFEDRGPNAHTIWQADYVSASDGTGIVHIAPAYGEEDYALAKANGIPLVNNLDDSGIYIDGEWKGQQVWEANKPIAKTLHERGVVWKIDYIRHSYPHCHRCGTKLLYRAHPSWFMNIEDQKPRMMEQNEPIHWSPGHIKHGRFAKTVESAPDWNLSRDRFWATAIPVWKGTDAAGETHVKVIGSYDELEQLSGQRLDDYHRPWIDQVTFDIDGVHYSRIDRVLDSWFESGSMPFAQFHYPFENKDKFEQNYPGDFIAEYVGQVRAWFYYLHAVGIGLFDSHAFKNVIVTGTLAGNDGRKMSKNYGNYTDPNQLMDKYSADALRFLLLSSPVISGEDFSLQDKDVADVQRKLAMVWNMYDFFTMYAEVDGWEWQGTVGETLDDLTNPLDRWVVARLHQLQAHLTEQMDQYDLAFALSEVLPFIDDASNWYVRRSRRRFWKSGDDADKQDAYRTLHYVLTRLSQLLAPFTPFLAEELFINLTGGESVHLTDWPTHGPVDDPLLSDMRAVRELITDGLAQRAKAGLKVRQPLASATLQMERIPEEPGFFEAIVRDELNVKQVNLQRSETESVVIDTTLNDALRHEGMARELIRFVQSARKQAGLQIDDRIDLTIATDDPALQQALSEHRQTIESEVLATGQPAPVDAFASDVTVEGAVVHLTLAKTP